MKPVYRPGFSFKVAPDVVVAELTRIRDEHGGADPAVVVEEARPAGAPLHPAFDWDDTDAAEKWRLHQARKLTKSVELERPDGSRVSAFYNVTVTVQKQSDDKPEVLRTYLPYDEVVSSPVFLRSATATLAAKVAEARRALETLRRAAGDDREREARFQRIASALDSAGAEVTALVQ